MDISAKKNYLIPNYNSGFSLTIKAIKIVPIVLISVILANIIYYSILRIFKKWKENRQEQSNLKERKIRMDIKPFVAVIFVVLWLFLTFYYCYLNKNELKLHNIFCIVLFKKVLILFLNVSISFIGIWVSLTITQISTNKFYYLIIILIILLCIYLIVKSFINTSISDLIFKLIFFISAIGGIIFFQNKAKQYLARFQKACKNLLDKIGIFFISYFVTSFIFLLQIICIANIVNIGNPSFISYIILIFIFEWSYNFATQFNHLFTSYIVTGMNLLEMNQDMDNSNISGSKIFNFPFLKAFIKVSITSLRPTLFESIPGISFLNPTRLPFLKFENNSQIFKQIMQILSFFHQTIVSEIDDDLIEWGLDHHLTTNNFKYKKITKQENSIGIIFMIKTLRRWIFRIPLILLTFSFLGLDKGDFVIDFNILSYIHNPLIFLRETLKNPNSNSISYLLAFFIFSCFILSVETSFSSNQYFINDNENLSKEEIDIDELSFSEKIRRLLFSPPRTIKQSNENCMIDLNSNSSFEVKFDNPKSN